jgi:lipoprotein-anchoring transpeptidase ErfK/SrfK
VLLSALVLLAFSPAAVFAEGTEEDSAAASGPAVSVAAAEESTGIVPLAEPVFAPVTVTSLGNGFIKVEVQVTSDVASVTGLKVALWAAPNSQDDLVWYTVNLDGSGYGTFTTSTSAHKGQSGVYYAHAYATTTADPTSHFKNAGSASVSHTGTETINIPPTSNGTSLTIQASGGRLNSSANIRFAVWSDVNGQDDLVWYTASANSGVLEYNVPVRNHKSTGHYTVHVYAGNTFIGGGGFTVASPAATLTLTGDADGNITVNVSSIAAGAYTNVSAKVAIWNTAIGGQDDLAWYTVPVSGDTVKTSTTAHLGQSGQYVAHLYVTDSAGAVTFSGSAAGNVTHPGNVRITTPVISGDGRSVTITAYGGVLGRATSVSFPTWSDKDGQDDLVWYKATRNSFGLWSVTIPLSSHKSTGLFYTHVYSNGTSFVGGTSFTAAAPVISGTVDFSGYNAATGEFTVTAHVDAAPGGPTLDAVYIPIWGIAGGQNDVVWHEATKSGTNTYTVTTRVPDHQFENTVYTAHVYAQDANGALTYVGGNQSPTTYEYTGPAVLTATLNSTQTEVVIAAGGGAYSSTAAVWFPTWSLTGGQDDIVWYNATKTGNAWIARVPLSNHRSTGAFSVHAYGAGGTLSATVAQKTYIGQTSFTVSAPTGSNVQFLGVNADTYNGSFSVHVNVTPGQVPIAGVKIAVWSAVNGQNDLRWIDAHVVSGNTWGVSDRVRDHRVESGTYYAHVYVVDANGAMTFVGSAVQTGILYTGPTTYGTYIEVNLTTQHMWYYVDGIPIVDTDVVTGLANTSRVTPPGNYRIQYKARNVTFDGGLFSLYWLSFIGNMYGFHDASWQNGVFGGNKYYWAGSHGCVNMPTEPARVLYETCPVGTEVRIHY